jgi:hypothetical protein
MMRRSWSLYGLLVLASVVYGAPLFFGLGQWGRGDWDQFSFRYETPRRALLGYGELPLWNPYVNGGNVLLAHPHCPALSPWYLPTLLLGAPLGLRFSVVLFVALGATGMAALLKRWGVSPGGCFTGGVLLMMSTHFALHLSEGHLEWCVLGLMPWVLLCLVRAEHDWRFAIFGALLFASALLYGSIYVVAVFVPVFVLWAVLEGIRTSSWRIAAGCAAVIGLTCLLCAVVLLPRIEFLRANPRRTRQDEQVSLAALGRMLLDPRQAELFRQTRDVRNPPDAELDRLLPARSSSSPKPYDTLKWHRLEVELTTNSDWTDVRFENFPYRLFPGGLGAEQKTAAQLNALPQTTEWLAIQNPDLEKSKQTVRATLYVRLPDEGDLQFLVTRGNTGATRLVVTHGKEPLLDVIHSLMEPGDLTNARTFTIPRYKILGRQAPDQRRPAGPWYRVEATLRTTAAWCDLQVVNSPYVFQIKGWKNRRQTEIRPSMSALATGSPSPGKAEAELEATLYFQCPEEENLRVAILQGPEGTSTLNLRTPEGDPIAAQRSETTAPSGEKTFEYLLPQEVLAKQLQPEPMPLRWRLNQWGMWRDWQEYGCYLTWVGLAMAVLGLVVSLRRQWPLILTGLLAGLVVLGAALPLNLWVLWKQLPLYGSLQVPSRFLVAVVFVIAVCGGYGVDRLGAWSQRLGGRWLGRIVVGGVGLAVYTELAVLGWNLFSDVFVCQPRKVPHYTEFAQRYPDDDAIRYPSMYSAVYPYLLGNSGVLQGYENIAVERGKIRLSSDPDYRGEAYLEGSHGTAEIAEWSMSRVKVHLDVKAPDRLVLNQNYFLGWKAIRRWAGGTVESVPSPPDEETLHSPDGLVWIGVQPGVDEVEFYYLPDSFVRGAVVSGATLLACVVLLLVGSTTNLRSVPGWRSWRLMRRLDAIVRRCGPVLRSPAAIFVIVALALNVPFLVCYPGWTLVDAPLVRSLAINAVLFLAPGLPLVGFMVGRGWLRRWYLLWVVTASLVVFVVMVLLARLVGRPAAANLIWGGTWVITNLAMLFSLATGGLSSWGTAPRDRHVWSGVVAFAAAYGLLFYSATRVVPAMEDLDYEAQGTAPSLLARFEPRVLTDRDTTYYFAHPPLVHIYVAGSFLYFDQLHHLDLYERAWQRVRAAESGTPIEPEVRDFYRLPNGRLVGDVGSEAEGATRHRIVGQEGQQYLVDPPLPGGGGCVRMPHPPTARSRSGGLLAGRIRVRDYEVQMLYDHYRHHPWRLATRTPSVFLSALAVGLLACWIGRMTGRSWLGLLTATTLVTGPEMFVRGVYAGQAAINTFLLVQILWLVEHERPGGLPSEGHETCSSEWAGAGATGLLAGVLAGLANQKLMLMPAALVAWELLRLAPIWKVRETVRAVLHPVALGFAAGTMLFWAWGLAISPATFWLEQIRYHLIDRLVHENPLGYANYPSVAGLWLEFWEHTGYVLLPLGIVALGVLCLRKEPPGEGDKADRATAGWRHTPGLWTLWALLTAVVFSLIDWRQTKHLLPLLLPLHLAPARWTAMSRGILWGVAVLFAGLLVWNLGMLRLLATDFQAFPITPAW